MAIGNNPLFTAMSGDYPQYAKRIEEDMQKRNRMAYSAEAQLIRGTMSFSKDKLKELDPSYTGYSHIFVLRMPAFMEAIASGPKGVVNGFTSSAGTPNYNNPVTEAQRHLTNLRVMLEMGSTSYSGTPDLTLNTSEVNTGFSERNYPAPTYSAYDGKTFTIRCLETRGEPLRRALEYYINGISDANVKATLLHGALDEDGLPMEPTLANYTFTIMVVQTDQTLRHIQDISIWNSCIITSAERSGQLDWENGSIDIVQPLDVSFSGVYMPDAHNSSIDNMALKLLGRRLKLYRRYSDMDADTIGQSYWRPYGVTTN